MNNLEIYQGENGAIEFKGDTKNQTVWASVKDISNIFEIDRSVVSRHIKNIFKDEELDKDMVCAKFAHTTSHGAIDGKTQTKEIDFYNLDIILAIGYRTNSHKAIKFRKWATSVLNKYLVDGYAINEKKLSNTKELLDNLNLTISMLSSKQIGQEKELLNLLNNYTKTLSLLENYDKASIDDFSGATSEYQISYDEVKEVLKQLKSNLIAKNEATELFATEKANELKGIVDNLYQTFGGVELYPSIENKASHLLYFIIKDHPFNDGNKRSASFRLFTFWIDVIIYIKRMAKKR